MFMSNSSTLSSIWGVVWRIPYEPGVPTETWKTPSRQTWVGDIMVRAFALAVGLPVRGAEFLRLDQMMEVVDRVVAEAPEVVALEDVEGFEHLERGERRRHREHLAVAIRDRRGLAPFWSERGQVALAQPPAGLPYRPSDRARDGPAVEHLGAALRHLTEGRPELLVGHDPARARAPVAEIEALRLRRAGERLARSFDEFHALERERDAVLGERDRRRQHTRAVHRTEALERGEPAAQIPGSAAGLAASDPRVVGT